MENIKKMKEIIKQMLFMACDEKNRDLANIASDLMLNFQLLMIVRQNGGILPKNCITSIKTMNG